MTHNPANPAAEPRVWTFFYGSYMNRAVLYEIGYLPERWEIARLPGFELRIAPLANLVRSDQGLAYGVVATATHGDLERLYNHAREVLGAVYRPEAVVVEARSGAMRPALCYLSSGMSERPADPAYVDRVARPARDLGFPRWYVERIESFGNGDKPDLAGSGPGPTPS